MIQDDYLALGGVVNVGEDSEHLVGDAVDFGENEVDVKAISSVGKQKLYRGRVQLNGKRHISPNEPMHDERVSWYLE